MADGGQHVGDHGVVEFVGQPVRAQEEPVTLDGLDPPEVDLDVLGHTEGPGEDVAVGMHGRFFGRDLPVAHHLLGQRVVQGQKVQVAVVEPVGPRVPDVDQRQDVVTVFLHQRHGGDGGAHAPQVGVVEALLPHFPVGGFHRTDQAVRVGLGPKHRGQGLDGGAGRHFSRHVAAHAVGHGKEAGGLQGQVLVDGPDQSGVGG